MASNPYVNKVQKADGTTIIDISDTTAVASDVASGKYFYTADGAKVQGTSSGGGGGASNVVMGTFKYTEQGWNTINLQYTGNGYPIVVIIFPKDGHSKNAISSQLRRYAIVTGTVFKSDATVAPSYVGGTDASDSERFVVQYKSSASDAASIGTSQTDSPSVYNTNELTTNAASYALRISAKNSLKVRMVDTTHNTSRYGFLVNIDYTYIVLYSS